MNRINLLSIICLSLLVGACNKDSGSDGPVVELPNLRVSSIVETHDQERSDQSVLRTVYTTTFQYDSDNRLSVKARKWIDDHQQERETKEVYFYENGHLAKVRHYDSTISDPDFFIWEADYQFDDQGRIDKLEKCYINANRPDEPNCYVERFIYGSDGKVSQVDRYYNNDQTERTSFRILKWADGNLLWEEHYQGDEAPRLYVRYDMTYDNKLNPLRLSADPSDAYRRSKNNVDHLISVDGGWYHGPALIDYNLAYTEYNLLKTSQANYFNYFENSIQLDYEYEEVP